MLEVAGLTVRFGGVTALHDVEFAVADGPVCGLIGPNGAGKTTLFNCVSRLVDPVAGSIRFDGTELLERSARTRSPRSASRAPSSTWRSSRASPCART